MRRSTEAWKLYVQWRDGSMSWKALTDLKELHPLEALEYNVAQEIDHNPAFNWWINAFLKTRLRIISICQDKKPSLPQEDT